MFGQSFVALERVMRKLRKQRDQAKADVNQLNLLKDQFLAEPIDFVIKLKENKVTFFSVLLLASFPSPLCKQVFGVSPLLCQQALEGIPQRQAVLELPHVNFEKYAHMKASKNLKSQRKLEREERRREKKEKEQKEREEKEREEQKQREADEAEQKRAGTARKERLHATVKPEPVEDNHNMTNGKDYLDHNTNDGDQGDVKKEAAVASEGAEPKVKYILLLSRMNSLPSDHNSSRIARRRCTRAGLHREKASNVQPVMGRRGAKAARGFAHSVSRGRGCCAPMVQNCSCSWQQNPATGNSTLVFNHIF